jgi:(S)-2-hydroxyglutarate dehydrogenase
MDQFDIAIIGGGIVGLATAFRALERFPSRRLVLLEKEARVAEHQSGHNSGVLHSGIYYRPGSLKAVNCRAGKQAMEEFCQAEDIPFEICGKVIVATTESELPALQAIFERGMANGVNCRLVNRAALAELEPHAAGIEAIHVPETGIVDFRQVCGRLAERVAERGGQLVFSARVHEIRRDADGKMILATAAGDFAAKQVINCAGLHGDRVARLSGDAPPAQIIPFRGEYYRLRPSAERLCRNLIYPVPDPNFPFLGMHFTRIIDGGVECGPNAVLALAREGYRRCDVRAADLIETLAYPGFWRLAARYWRTGMGEMWRSLSKRAFVRALQRLVPAVQIDDLEPAPAGVRAQAVARDGSMVDDFVLIESPGVIHVCNAPSPAATASLNIGKLIVDKLADRLR